MPELVIKLQGQLLDAMNRCTAAQINALVCGRQDVALRWMQAYNRLFQCYALLS